jgi:hypothetical protein
MVGGAHAPFAVGEECTMAQLQLALGRPDADGVFLFGRDAAALVVAIGDGDDDPWFTHRAALRFPGPVPPGIVDRQKQTIWLFVRRGRAAAALTYMGDVFPSQYSLAGGQPHDVLFQLTPRLARPIWLALLGDRVPAPGAAPETELARLDAASTPRQRWQALMTFIARWHGTATSPPFPSAVASGLELLRVSVAALAAIPDLFSFNTLVPPDELAIEQGRIVFLRENQNVCLWAADEDQDPRVFYRENDPREPWLEEPQRLSGFLIQAVLFESIMHAKFGAVATCLAKHTADAVIDRLQPIAGGSWNWNGTRFFARDGALAMANSNGGEVDLYLAALTPLALSPFEDLVTADWDHVAF